MSLRNYDNPKIIFPCFSCGSTQTYFRVTFANHVLDYIECLNPNCKLIIDF